MSVNIPNHYVDTFNTNVTHLLQYKGSKLRGKVMERPESGEDAALLDRFGAVEPTEVTTRFEPMSRTDIDHDRVWLAHRAFDLQPLHVDKFDEFKIQTDPRGPYTEAAAKAFRRHQDRILFDAFYAPIRLGRDGGMSESFDTTNHRVDAAVGASADTGLNLEKINAGLEVLMNAEVDLEEEDCYLAISPKQNRDLIRQEQVLSDDKQKALGITVVNGMVKNIAGCGVVVSTFTPSNTNYRLVPMWVKSGMHLGVWGDVQSAISQRHDLRGTPWQLYCYMNMAATRTEAGKVIQIECTE